MFDSIEKFDSIPYRKNDCTKHREINHSVTRKTMTLLKNNGVLPLSPTKLDSIAVIGPRADDRLMLSGNYHGTASQYVTILDGIRAHLNDSVRIYYSEGCHKFKERTEDLAHQDDRISEAVIAAKNSDVAIVCLGLDETMEGEEFHDSNAFGSGDRESLALPESQQRLLQAVQQTGVPTILVLCAGSALELNWADENVDAILDAWYPGAQGGAAVAAALFGAFSPAGRLPVTFYRSTQELPEFTDYSMRGRTYRFMKNEALYPFGFGLSYTKFEYSDLKLSKTVLKSGEALELSVTVTNTGSMSSDEVTECYIKDNEASTEVPNFSLCAFRRTHIKAGQSKTITLTVSPDTMRVVDDKGGRYIEPGEFTLWVGSSAPDSRSAALLGASPLCASFSVE